MLAEEPGNRAGEPGEATGRRRRIDEATAGELMAKYQNADRAAADELVRMLTPLLLGYLSHPGQSRSVTEDLVQECWLRIHRSRHTYRPSEPVLPWIFAIARHTSLDGYRKRRRVESREVLTDQLPERARAEEGTGKGLGDELGRLVEELPQSQRDVIVMLKVSGMSLEEVARATSSSVGSVKQKAHRAYEKLRRMLGERREHGRKSDH